MDRDSAPGAWWPEDAPHPADDAGEPLDLPGDMGDPGVPPIEGNEATWGQAPAEQAAIRVAAMQDVFIRSDGSALVWVDDRGWSDIRPRMADIDQPMLRGLLNERRVVFASQVWNAKKKVHRLQAVAPPFAVCERIVTTRPGSGWRFLHGIADAPYVLGDGSLVNDPGYRDGLWLCKNSVVPIAALPESARPTPDGWNRDDSAFFVRMLFSQLAEVEWQDECDKSAAFAYMLTLLTRPAYRLAPIFLFTAPDSGSGKDFVAKFAEHAILGFEALRITPPSGRADDASAEMDKRLGTALKDGESAVVLGDISKLSSPTIYGLTTDARSQGFRLLGASKAIPAPRNLILAGTGNNPSIGTDLVRRSVSCRLMSTDPEPGARKFSRTEGAIFRDLDANRAVTIAALTNIVRGALRDRPPGLIPCSPFDDWSAIVQAACVYVGLPDPLLGRQTLRDAVADDDPRRILAPIIEQWFACFGQRPMTASQLVAPMTSGDEMTTPYRAAMHEAGLKPDPASFGKLLTACRDKPFSAHLSDGTAIRVRLTATRPGNVRTYRLLSLEP